MDLSHRPGINERVIDMNQQVTLSRFLNEPLGFRYRPRHRLLHPDMLAGAECFHSNGEVFGDRCGNRDRIDGAVAKHITVIGRRAHGGIAQLHLLQTKWVDVADHHHAHLGKVAEITDQVGAPVAVSDNANL